MPDTFSPGDIVRLKSGGPKMTVVIASPTLAGWWCLALAGAASVCEVSLPAASLEIAEPEPEAVPEPWAMSPGCGGSVRFRRTGDGGVFVEIRRGRGDGHEQGIGTALTPAEASEFGAKLVEFADACDPT